jgi:hypothetical protein
MFELLFSPEDGGRMILRNICEFPLDYTAAHPLTQCPSSKVLLLTSKFVSSLNVQNIHRLGEIEGRRKHYLRV